MATKRVKECVNDMRMAIRYFQRMGMKITGISISCGKKLTKYEATAISIIANEIKQTDNA
jgi:hypothetical protein